MQKVQNYIRSGIFFIISVVVLAATAMAVLPGVAGAADAKREVCSAIGGSTGRGGCTTDGTSVDNALTAVINVLSLIVGIVAVIMIIIAGFKYITSSGDSNNINSAKTTLVYAIVGLIIVALAQVIVRFVLSKL